MKLRPYLSSTITGAVINIVWSVIALAASLLFLKNSLTPLMENPETMNPDQAIGMMGGGLIVMCLSLLVGFVVYAGSGFLYAYRYREEATLTADAGMLGGAAVGASVFIISQLAGYLVSFIAAPWSQSIVPASAPLPNGLPSNGLPLTGPNMATMGIVITLFSFCGGLVVATLVGVVGGLAGSLVLKDNAS